MCIAGLDDVDQFAVPERLQSRVSRSTASRGLVRCRFSGVNLMRAHNSYGTGLGAGDPVSRKRTRRAIGSLNKPATRELKVFHNSRPLIVSSQAFQALSFDEPHCHPGVGIRQRRCHHPLPYGGGRDRSHTKLGGH